MNPPARTPTAPGPAPFLDSKESLACIHCGLCLSSCPTYLETGNENDSPRGRIYLMRAIQDGRMPLAETAVHHIDLCLGCRACETACPSGVKYGNLLEATRDHIEGHYQRPLAQRLLRQGAIEQIFPFGERMELALLPARLAQATGLARFLPKFARDSLALIPEKFSSARWLEVSPATGGTRRGAVAFVRGCVMNVMFGPTHLATVRLLNRAGYDVVTPPDQGCCGALYAHGGNLAAARESARKNIAVFEEREVEAIIINAAGCGSTLKEYGHLLAGDPLWAARAQRFSAKVRDLSEWLATSGLATHLAPTQFASPVTFHDACHLAHPQKITQQPRALVKAVAGSRFVELPEAEICCGSAGSYNLTEPEMAGRLGSRKTGNILQTGAKTVVTTNPGCILQMQAGLREAGVKDVEVLHLADFLDRHCHY
ncbi:glycolate oxidase iron-sulfur subunit [Verrucomicrobiota bacterium]|nr:glycolate oxidase iron-sulfur subunit [Verrucomicrobiota bacterium]